MSTKSITIIIGNPKVKVVDWVAWEEAGKKYPENDLGGMGGWFHGDQGHTWDTYINNLAETERIYAEALKKEILSKNIRIGGNVHQHSDGGTPLFSDGTVSTFSYRAWGDIMAAIYSHEEPDINYMAYYMT